MITQGGITVTELNLLIAEALRNEPRIRSVRVTGEISGFKHHLASGHWYFSLKDGESAIGCVMFRQNNIRAAIKPRDGDRVTVSGHVEIYTRDGKVQLYVTALQAAGVGTLYEQFEALKQKLSSEGLFDQGRKRVLPQVPRKVAVVTSASGAALHDILNVSGMRCPWIPIVVVPSAVQGAGAAEEIVRALKQAALVPETEVIILARGGGSMEDLWCFNDEAVARAVAASPLPVVTGVGHETDTTMVDFVSDVRASTPSNAAEIVFPDRKEMRGRAALFRANLNRAMNGRIQQGQLKLHETRGRLIRQSPERRLHLLTDLAHQHRQRLIHAIGQTTDAADRRLKDGASALNQRIERLVLRTESDLKARRDGLNYAIGLRSARAENELARRKARLEALSPLRVLDRGYALVGDESGRILPSASEARQVRAMWIRFRDGQVAVRRMEGDADGSDL